MIAWPEFPAFCPCCNKFMGMAPNPNTSRACDEWLNGLIDRARERGLISRSDEGAVSTTNKEESK